MSVYARILRTPGIALIVLASVIGRLPISITGLAILLYVRDVTGSFAAAGICTGALALGTALGAPIQGRLVDRRGLGMLVPLAVLHAAGLLAIWIAGAADAPAPALASLALLTGAALPPVSPVLRSRWPHLLAEQPDLVASAFAFDSVLIEIVFIAGPVLTTVIVATVGPQYALAVAAACVLIGTLMMLHGLRGRPGPERAGAGAGAFGLGALADPGLRTLVFASLPVGFAVGSVEVAVPAFCDSEGFEELAGLLLAVWSCGSAVAGLAWGARPYGGPLTTVHLWCAWLLPAATAPIALASSAPTMAVLVALAGLPIAPLIASRNQLIERVTPPGTATEAYTWPLTALVTGVSLGAAAAGAVVEASSWTTAVLLGATVAALGAAIVATRRQTLLRPQPACG